MKKLFIFFIISLFISACTLNKVVNHHGVHFLEKKQELLIVNKSNRNDVLEILGPPSTKGTFDNDVWFYIESKSSTKGVMNFGKKTVFTNNVLVIEINKRGIITKKKLFDKDKMMQIERVEKTTSNIYTKNTFMYDFLSSMRQKINDPLGVRKKK